VTEEVLKQSSLLGIVKTIAKILREEESNLLSLLSLSWKKGLYLRASWSSSGVASGKSMLGVTEPMVGWKRAPLSVVTSCF
jgi:hypothetical protein